VTSSHRLQVVQGSIERRIHIIRGEKVVLDTDLAVLYGIQPKRLNEQVKRNRRRFPCDFMFRLTAKETRALRSQVATLDRGRGRHRKYAPYAFTAHGVVMLASVLNSDVAIRVSLQIVRAFVRLRGAIAAHTELARKLEQLERKYDGQFSVVFEAIRQLMAPRSSKPKRAIGFRTRTDRDASTLAGRIHSHRSDRDV
jgi:ORF6N domain-containing protein